MNGYPKSSRSSAGRRTIPYTILAVGLSCLVAALAVAFALPAGAATGTVGLGTAASYSVLGGSAVTNTGPSTLAADLGVSPGTAITGFPPGIVGGAVHAADAAALQAKSDLAIAYNDAAGRALTASVAGDLVGRTLIPGVYKSTSSLALTGTVTLDAQGDPGAVFIFQVASTLTTFSASNVLMTNGADACHVFWQIGSSATLGTNSVFNGTIMALTSITVQTGTVVHGRALARNGAVTLDTNVFTSPACTPATVAASSSSAAAAASSSSAARAASASAARASSIAAARSSASAAAARSSLIAAQSSTIAATQSSGNTTTTVANTGPRGPVVPLLALSGGLIGLGLLLLVANRRRERSVRYASAHRR